MSLTNESDLNITLPRRFTVLQREFMGQQRVRGVT